METMSLPSVRVHVFQTLTAVLNVLIVLIYVILRNVSFKRIIKIVHNVEQIDSKVLRHPRVRTLTVCSTRPTVFQQPTPRAEEHPPPPLPFPSLGYTHSTSLAPTQPVN